MDNSGWNRQATIQGVRQEKMSTTIVTFQQIQVRVADLQEDPTNPNRMSAEQFNRLKESIKTNGFTQAVMVDANNTLIDGHHRYRAAKELGLEEIPAYNLGMPNPVQRRLIRQAMNKNHGEHDLEADLADLKYIMENAQEGMDMLQKLLGVNDEAIKKMEKVLAAGTPKVEGLDTDPKGGYVDSFLHGNIKQITLYYKNEDYEAIMPRLQKVMEAEQLEDHTALFMAAFEAYWKAQGYGEEPANE